MPKISVIIPTYNRERYVVKAVASVLHQTFEDFEIIVVDDGSVDDTQKVLRAFSTRINYIYQSNSRVSSARNNGIRAAKGEWVAFLDSDDSWNKDYLARQFAQIIKYPLAVAHIANGVTIISHDERRNLFDETNFLRRFRANQDLIFKRPVRTIVKYGSWFIQSTIVRKDILFKAGLFDVELSLAEDLDVIARVALEGPITFCKRELVEVYRGEESIEHLMAQAVKRGIYRFRAFGKVYANLLNSKKLTRREKPTVAKALSCSRRGLGNVLVMAGRKIDARNNYKESFFLYPSVRSLAKFLATFLPVTISRFLVRSGKQILPGADTTINGGEID
jgi:glycosyltransferase involved in cell wall biosynthesis